VKSEGNPLDPKPVAAARDSMAAMEHLDKVVTGAGGIALRYGIFYGDPDDGMVEAVRARKFPIAGEQPVVMATESRGASNAKAKRELGWTLRYSSWRQGFADLYARPTTATSAPRAVPANAERVASRSR
jgi:nucleoside-diphosphate-sugar epimerase